MSTKDEIRRNITKGDVILIISLLIISLILFVFPFSGNESLRAEIYAEGEKIQSIVLSDVTEEYILKVNSCEILVEKDGVSFLSSDCSDKLCIKKGKLKRQGDTMACVPQRVVVILKSDRHNEIDGVAY